MTIIIRKPFEIENIQFSQQKLPKISIVCQLIFCSSIVLQYMLVNCLITSLLQWDFPNKNRLRVVSRTSVYKNNFVCVAFVVCAIQSTPSSGKFDTEGSLKSMNNFVGAFSFAHRMFSGIYFIRRHLKGFVHYRGFIGLCVMC